MKRQIAFLLVILCSIVLSESCNNLSGQPKSAQGKYISGTYSGISRSKYTSESFYGKVRFTIVDGQITNVDFIIRDSANHETFDGNYEKHFVGNQEYIDQCRNDWKGVQNYPSELLKKQDIEKIDAVSGATWSYNIFKAAAKEALKKATK